jgi:NIPSNAP
VIQQLRIYEIFENNKAAFHARFRDHAARIMATYGFRILAMWEAKTELKPGEPKSGEPRTEFIYILEWPDEATKTAAWAAFMKDEEWAQIKRVTSAEHGTLVGGIEDRTMTLTAYSPAIG